MISDKKQEAYFLLSPTQLGPLATGANVSDIVWLFNLQVEESSASLEFLKVDY